MDDQRLLCMVRARTDELLREAEQARLVRQARRARPAGLSRRSAPRWWRVSWRRLWRLLAVAR